MGGRMECCLRMMGFFQPHVSRQANNVSLSLKTSSQGGWRVMDMGR